MPNYDVKLRGAEGEEVSVGVVAGGTRGAENLAKHEQAKNAEGHRANPNYWTPVAVQEARPASKSSDKGE